MPSIAIQFVSDIHLEFYASTHQDFSQWIDPAADYLALLGDIGNPFSPNYTELLQWCSQHFKRTFVIAGNHEFYSGKNHSKVLQQISDVCAGVDRVEFLNDTLTHIDGVRVFGCTLWSLIRDSAAEGMNDYRYMKEDDGSRVKPATTRSWHLKSVAQIDSLLKDSEEPLLVLTHHGALDAMNGKYTGNALSSAFASDLKHLFRTPLVGWLSGHTHQSLTLEENGLASASNCVGYPREGVVFDKKRVLHIVY